MIETSIVLAGEITSLLRIIRYACVFVKCFLRRLLLAPFNHLSINHHVAIISPYETAVKRKAIDDDPQREASHVKARAGFPS